MGLFKNIRIWTFITFCALGLGCEKDDLCTIDAPKTPRMIIVFRDAIDPTIVKPVVQLSIRDLNRNDSLPLNSEGATLLETTDSIAIPLNSSVDLTQLFVTVSVEGDENIDQLDVTYNLKDEYVNRACGYRTIYNNIDVVEAPVSGSTPWISSILRLVDNVDNQNEIHLEIRH